MTSSASKRTAEKIFGSRGAAIDFIQGLAVEDFARIAEQSGPALLAEEEGFCLRVVDVSQSLQSTVRC